MRCENGVETRPFASSVLRRAAIVQPNVGVGFADFYIPLRAEYNQLAHGEHASSRQLSTHPDPPKTGGPDRGCSGFRLLFEPAPRRLTGHQARIPLHHSQGQAQRNAASIIGNDTAGHDTRSCQLTKRPVGHSLLRERG